MPDTWESYKFDLRGRNAVVTGASRGIGLAIAEALSGVGANVIGVSRTGCSAGKEAGVTHRKCDVSDMVSLSSLVNTLENDFSQLDILVNAAGISVPSAPQGELETEIQRFRTTIDSNLVSPFSVVVATLPLLRISGKASIINITSINSVLGFPDNPGYVASKSGLAGLTRALAVDLAPSGIRVNAVAPGYIHTEMTSKSYSNPQAHDLRMKHTILRRWGSPQDVTGAVMFLASDAAQYITGHELFVDGGWAVNGLIQD